MSFFKWLKGTVKKMGSKNTREDSNSDDNNNNDNRQREEEQEENQTETSHNVEEVTNPDLTKFVYFASTTPNENVIDVFNLLHKDVQIFTDENKCIECIQTITDKVFLIIDGQPSTTLIEAIEPLKQIDSVFFYSTSSDTITAIRSKPHTYIHYLCENSTILKDSISKSREELDQQTAAFNMFNKNGKISYNLLEEQGSFLAFQLFKSLLKVLPKTSAAKQTMITLCRHYYRGNLTELSNIDDFDRNYKSCDAIPWFTKDTFVYKLIKSIRMEDFELLYLFRFYIMDLSEQLELKFEELKKKQKNVLKLYRSQQLSQDQMTDYQNNIGSLILFNQYSSVSGERSVAYGFLRKFPKQEGVVRALIEYLVDLNIVQKVVVADVRQYSAFPEDAEFIFDIGASFQIDSCEYNAEEDLWYMTVHATDQAIDLASEYIKYEKGKMAQSNMLLYFGNLHIEMGKYDEAERYFDTILNSSNPNDEEISFIFYYFGRIYRLKGNFNRAISCYNRAYHLHMNARPKRRASAGKALNGLGIVYSEKDQQLKAEECFKSAMDLYKKSLPKNHIDVAGTLINLGIIDCSRQNFDQAVIKYNEAKKIYDSSLPSFHPYRAFLRINFGNIYLTSRNYQMALDEYEAALNLQKAILPADHPYIARTLHLLAIVHAYQENLDQANKYLERAQKIANKTLSFQNPVMTLTDQTKYFFID